MDKLITKLDTNLGPVLREQLDSNFQKIQNGVDGQADSLNKQIETMLGDVPLQDKNEVTQARIDDNNVVYSTLKGRLDVDQGTAETALKEERLTGIEVQAARSNSSGKSYDTLKARLDDEEANLTNNMNAKIAQISSIPETFANLSTLKSTYPNGKTGLFVTADTGHKYIWANNSWLDAGVYQSVGIADGSITNAMLAPETKTGFLVTGAPVVLSTANRTLSIKTVYQVRAGTAIYSVAASSYNFSMSANKSGFYLYYDTVSHDLNLVSTTIPATGIALGWISLGYSINYQIMASSVVDDIENKSIKPTDRVPFISTGGSRVNVNTTDKTLEINVPYFNVFYAGASFSITVSGTVNIDTGTGASFIFYDTATKTIVSKNTTNDYMPYTYVPLGFVEWGIPTNSILHFPATIDGIVIDKSNQFGKRVSIASKLPLEIDTVNKTINVAPSGFANLDWEGAYTSIIDANATPVDISASGANASYIFINATTLKITALPHKLAPSGYLYLGWIDWGSLNHNFEFNVTFTGSDSLMDNPLALRKATFFGDSITWSYNPIKWANLTANKLGATATLNAIAGSSFTSSSDRSDSAVDRAPSITGQDLVVVWFGINDFHIGRQVGTFKNGDTTTLFGAVDFVLNTLITNNPAAKIMVMTPMKQHGYATSVVKPDSFTANSIGLQQIEYVNAIKQVADYYSVPVLDMYAESGMSPFNENQKMQYFRDGLHPNQAGEYRVARKVLGFIESEL